MSSNSELPPLPPISSKQLKGVVDILISLKDEKGEKLLTKEQATELASLRFSNGETILNLEHRWFIYEMVWLVNKKGYEITTNFLSVNWEKALGSHNIRKKMFFENPLMEGPKEKFAVDMEIYRNKSEVVVGGEACRKCRSSSTISLEVQCRSADESVTIKVTCLECGYKWTAQ